MKIYRHVVKVVWIEGTVIHILFIYRHFRIMHYVYV